MKIGFIILAHNHPDAVRRLVETLSGERNLVVIHFDRSAPADQQAEVRKLEQSYPGRLKVVSRVHCVWGEWSLVEAVLVALQEFRRMGDSPDYIHLMSGADFPIRPIADFEEFLIRNPDQDFIECCDITQRRWVKGGLSLERFRFYFPVNFRTSRKTFDRLVRWHRKLKIRRRIPLGMTPHMGSQWWTLRWQSCERILDFLQENPKVVRYFRSTWIPDETFFQTVLAHLVPKHEIADLQLMLHHLTATGRPYVFYSDHLPLLSEMPHFFVRKVAPSTLGGLEELVANRRSPIPETAELARVRDQFRGRIDGNYQLSEIVPGHPHGPAAEREVPKLLVFLTMSNSETDLVKAYAKTTTGANWVGRPFAAGGIRLTAAMQKATGLTRKMTSVRENFTDQFVDTIAAALPSEGVSVAVLQFGDLGEDFWNLDRIPGSVFLSAHLQLLPHWKPATRFKHLPERRFRAIINSHATGDPVAKAPGIEVHEFMRAGHYYFLDATLHGCRKAPSSIRLILPGLATTVRTNLLHTLQESDTSHRFIVVVWIDDGAFLGIAPHSPGYLLAGSRAAPHPLHQVTDSSVHKLTDRLTDFGSPTLWSNRTLLEFVQQGSIKDRFAFLKKAKQHWPKEEISSLTEVLIDREESSREFFRMAALEEERDKTDELIELAEQSNPQDALWDSAQTSIRVLATRDLEAACRLAIKSIESREVPDEALIEAVQPCLPMDSKWWPMALGKQEGLGAEQKADAFNAMGVAAFHKGDNPLAELCYVVAAALNDSSQAVAWNLGLLRSSQGRTEEALAAFSNVSRHYSNESICSAWPANGDEPWPARPWSVDGFCLPEGISEWPRISIITPSYNQASYLGENIRSILHQNYPNIQFIVVDGDSTDGSREILESYREQIDHLIIEPDDGQTQAINKGMRLADGELVAWLNSDDVYAPGALHQIALRYLSTGAEVIAGICAEHNEHRLKIINRPEATNRDFNVSELARIFPNWFAGMFFFQPEVFFTRELFERVGLLDESLYFTMDYDLWMRFAREGARLEVTPWPVAFFCLHDAQKTSRAAECITEQCEVRNRYHSLKLSEQRQHQIVRQLEPLSAEDTGILFWAPYFPSKLESATRKGLPAASVISTPQLTAGQLPNHAAVVILIGPCRSELPLLKNLRDQNPDLLIAGWFMDTGLDPHANHDAALLVDVIIPSAKDTDDYLRHDGAVFTEPLAPSEPLPLPDCVQLLRSIDPSNLSC